MTYQLNVNGNMATVDVPADTPLLWVLREELQLPGSKFGCGSGHCGACTVHLDGKAVSSCTIPVSEAVDKKIVTIEGLSVNASHAVQLAWLELDVPQCGYCQAGQMMTAAALLTAHPDPTDTEIDLAMEHVLCRCGTYLRIRQAIHRAAELAAMPAIGELVPANDAK